MSSLHKLVPGPPTPDDEAFSIDGPRPPLINPGQYLLSFRSWETRLMFGVRPKLILHFLILDPPAGSSEILLAKYYNVRRLRGSAGLRGKFVADWKTNFVRDYVRLFGAPDRLDRIALSVFSRVVVSGIVETVAEDGRGEELPTACQYSVIRRLVSIEMRQDPLPRQ